MKEGTPLITDTIIIRNTWWLPVKTIAAHSRAVTYLIAPHQSLIRNDLHRASWRWKNSISCKPVRLNFSRYYACFATGIIHRCSFSVPRQSNQLFYHSEWPSLPSELLENHHHRRHRVERDFRQNRAFLPSRLTLTGLDSVSACMA